MASSAPKPIWVRQAEEAKIKSDAETAAAAKAAFEATFNPTFKSESASIPKLDNFDSDSDDDTKPSSPASIGPVDPNVCIVAGLGVAGGESGTPVSFTLTLKDSNEIKIPHGGAVIKAKISPGPGVGGSDIEGMVKDSNDGTYSITYLVPKRGNYNVHVSVDDKPIAGSPFPVFFSTGTATTPTSTPLGTMINSSMAPMYGMINQTMPNMPNYMVGTGLGMMATGNTGGVILQGAGASLGEVCREYLYGKCAKIGGQCKFGHPPQALLMNVLATAATSMSGGLMGPSAAAMAAAQAIVAAQALQAHASQMKSSTDASGSSPDKAAEAKTLKRTIQVSNLSPLLTTDQLRQLFGCCGMVTDCTITDSKHFAYIEYDKPEAATSALSLNNIDVGGRPLNVEMAKSLPVKQAGVNNATLPTMMQQAVAHQQMQFQQALAMQQAAATQAAAARAATMKSATEAAAARAREISMKLKAEGGLLGFTGITGTGGEGGGGESGGAKEEKEEEEKKEKSRSPVKYRSSRRRSRSKTYSPPIRRRRSRSRSPVRSFRYSSGYRGKERERERDEYSHSGRRERDRRESERRDRDRREVERKDRKESDRKESEKDERERKGSQKGESERGERERRGSERRESDKSRGHHSSGSRREKERRERSRSRERKYEKHDDEKDETIRDKDYSREDKYDNHDRVNDHKDPKPDRKEKMNHSDEEEDLDKGDERETLPSSGSKSYKGKLNDDDDYDTRHNHVREKEYSREKKDDRRYHERVKDPKSNKKERVVEDERDSDVNGEERETLVSSGSRSKKRKLDHDDDEDEDRDRRYYRRSDDKSGKSKEEYHDRKSGKKNRDTLKAVRDSESDRWMLE